MIVKGQEGVEGALGLRKAGEIARAELHAPVLVEVRARQPVDHAVGPGVSAPGAGVTDAKVAAGLSEGVSFGARGDVQALGLYLAHEVLSLRSGMSMHFGLPSL